MEWLIPGVVLGAIIAFVAFRLMGKKIIKPKESVKNHFKLYKLSLHQRVARRVDSYDTSCAECRSFQKVISKLTEGLDGLSMMTRKQQKHHLSVLGKVVKHLRKKHNLVDKGAYKELYTVVGLIVGAMIPSIYFAIHFASSINPSKIYVVLTAIVIIPLGLAIGAFLGSLIGPFFDKHAAKEGRVI